jgi:hypothetical protein
MDFMEQYYEKDPTLTDQTFGKLKGYTDDFMSKFGTQSLPLFSGREVQAKLRDRMGYAQNMFLSMLPHMQKTYLPRQDRRDMGSGRLYPTGAEIQAQLTGGLFGSAGLAHQAGAVTGVTAGAQREQQQILMEFQQAIAEGNLQKLIQLIEGMKGD